METRFRAMNTEIAVTINELHGHDDWAAQVQQSFRDMEMTASRFVADSELSRWNAAPVGMPYALSKRLYELTAYAWQCARKTDFRFHPCVGSTLAQFGYDRSFEKLQRTDEELSAGQQATLLAMGSSERRHLQPEILGFSEHDLTITKHISADIDLGGIGKGWTVDQVYHMLRDDYGVHSGVIDAGGDMRVWGEGTPWQIGVQHPSDEDRELVQLWMKQGAIATSNVLYRRWQHHGQLYHHIIDGRTLQPANSDIVQATVLAPTTALAEVVSKVICMLPSSEVNAWVASHFAGVGYLFLTREDEIKLNREVKHYVEELNW
ncbi:FAD:protein FMN transferase [Paenibacillus guangzhouensis]|uniref:FAD:protein FMN transferase n=1 Tax=Paenibacillus guangzhouensis TaxID=1473112 RepID=UPI0012674A11|nr:FAD:protein FMN transferase [Paenibacillus guangzhouensis]